MKIDGEIRVTCSLAIELMRIGMIADEVSRLVPGGKQLGPVGVVHANPANEQRGADVFLGNRFQYTAIGFLPFENGSDRERRIIESECELGPRGIVGRSFWRSTLWKERSANCRRKELRANRGRGGFYCVREKSATFHGNNLNEGNASTIEHARRRK